MKKYLSILLITIAMCACQTSQMNDVVPGSQADLEMYSGDCVLFDLNSARLDEEAREALDKQAEWLQRNVNVTILIEGHCDARGTREYNLALGAKRANAVRDYLIARKISAPRIRTISYGKENPPIPGSGEEVWKQNRRAVTTITLEK